MKILTRFTILFFALSMLPVFVSCGQRPAKKIDQKTDSTITQAEPIRETWIDSFINHYIHLSNNELIKATLKEKIEEEWLLDQVLITDTASYLIYQIGHDVAEEDGSEPRFVTDQWVYIDTSARKLYEYDLPNDSLTLWQ